MLVSGDTNQGGELMNVVFMMMNSFIILEWILEKLKAYNISKQ